MDFRILGPLAVVRNDEPLELGGFKQRAVLAALLTHVNRVVSTNRLLEAVWGESSDALRRRLWVYVSNLRSLLEPGRDRPGSGDVLVTHVSGYEIRVSPDDLDATHFERLVEEARALVDTDPGRASVLLRDALGVWRGKAYQDFTYEIFAEDEIRRLEELRLQAVELRIDADLAAGRHDALTAEVEALAEEHPTRERFRAQHMLALYRSGRQAEALRAFRRTQSYLIEELGIDPSQELQDLELAILDHDPELYAGSGRATTQRFAFLVTDIAESTGVWDRAPQSMVTALTIHDEILGETIDGARGRIFKHTGEGVLAVFPDAVAAAQAAETAQCRLAQIDWGEIGQLRVRMGVDVGEAESRGGDFQGPPLNRAARLAAAAHGGQVLVSGAAQTEITAGAPAGVQIRQLGEHRLRGLALPERIGQLVIDGLPSDFPDLNADGRSVLDDSEPPLSLPGYELRERIGEGTFGVVWSAYQPSVGREVAIKVIRSDLASHPEFIRGFEAEARTIARLAHPHIVPLIDFWRDLRGAYLVLQLVPAGSVRDLRTGDVELGTARRILRQVGEALDHIHARGVTHGDIQPANVLLDGAGNAYLSDFGIAARLIDPAVAAFISAAPEYQAPEQRTTGPSPAADRYALGVLASKLVGPNPHVEAVISKATAPNPDDRYPSAAEFLTELEEALGEEQVELELSAVVRNPYKGLRAFDESDAADFYGREELVSNLVAAVEQHRFVTVVGPSGSGKSSAVRAGLLPALAARAVDGSENWFWAVMTPGSHPLDALVQALEGLVPSAAALAERTSADDVEGAMARVLADAPGELVLVVDQFEELFTLVHSPERRQAFLELLIGAVEAEHSRLRVVATLRADFYHRPLGHDRLGRLVRDGLVTVLPPTWEELEEMISRPAMSVGLRWESGLPQRIAHDVIGEPGGLPLLQFGLSELVEQRLGEVLTTSDYERVGGVATALANRAEAQYGQLTPDQQEVARRVLLRLVTVEEDAETTRRRVRRSELESLDIDQQELDIVLEAFTTERLLLADRDPITRGPTVEVAHEALLVRWRRFREWIDQQRESLLMARRLRIAMEEWLQADRDPAYLLTGSRLAPFMEWQQTATLTADERAFLDASKERDQAEQNARTRRRRVLTGVLAGAGLVAAVLATLAFIQGQRASDEAERAVAAEARAEDQAAIARSRELAASAVNVLDRSSELSLLLALAAMEGPEPLPEAVSALHEAVQQHRTERVISWPASWGNADSVTGSQTGSISPDGRYLAVSGGAEQMAVWNLDAEDQDPWRFFEVAGPEYVKVVPRFTTDGSQVVATVSWFSIHEDAAEWPEPPPEVGVYVFDAETGDIVDHFRGPDCPFIDLRQSSRFLDRANSVAAIASSADDCSHEQVAVWLLDLETGESRPTGQQLAGSDEFGWDLPVSLSDDGTVLAFRDGATTRVVNLETGEETFSTPAGGNARLNRTGTRLLSSGQSTVQLFDLHAGTEPSWSFPIRAASDWWFSEDETLVYGGGDDGIVYVLDAGTGESIHRLPGPRIPSWFHSMTSDNRLLASMEDRERNIRIWDVTSGARGEISGFDLPGRPVLQGGNVVDDQVAMILYPEEQSDFIPVSNRPPERLVAVGEAVVLDAMSGEITYRFGRYGGRMVRLSPDGTKLAGQPFLDPDVVGPVHIRDLDTNDLVELDGLCGWSITELRSGPDCAPGDRTIGQLSWLEFSPDGSMLAVNGQTAGVWDTESGRPIVLLEEAEAHSVFKFSLNSDMLMMTTHGPPFDWMHALDTETWDEVNRIDIFPPAWWDLKFSTDGSLLYGLTGEAIDALDINTSTLILDPYPIFGSNRDIDVSQDGSTIAAAGTDGIIRIHNAESGEILQEIPVVVPGDIPGVTMAHFIDDSHLFVVAGDNSAMIVTTDVDELIELARSRLTRGFLAAECHEFDFETCPSLEDMRAEPDS